MERDFLIRSLCFAPSPRSSPRGRGGKLPVLTPRGAVPTNIVQTVAATARETSYKPLTPRHSRP
jgi:hypothetical protein